MRPVVINGFFLNDRLTGIERFGREITSRLDELLSEEDYSIIIPPHGDEKTLPLKKINYIKLAKIRTHHQLKRTRLQFHLIKHNALCLTYSNTCTPLYPGIVFLHDIYCRQFPQDFITKEDKKTMKRSRFIYWWIAKFAKVICTVSEYSKEQIVKYYHVNPDKIKVIYSGSDHMNSIVSDNSIFNTYPILKEKPFYFTLGSLSLRKNLKWIVDHAEKNPEELFVISGTALLNVIPPELAKIKELKNIILAGYLSDGQVKALYENCKAFVFPSYFEGFGLPPLEALSCGAQIIISNAACLPEIYGKCAHYIDPFKSDVDLDKLLAEPVESPEPLFEKYSLRNSAKNLYALIQKINK